MTRFISIDPGKSKCGLVVADSKKKVITFASIIKSRSLIGRVKELISEHQEYKVIIGNGTTSKDYIKKLDFLDQKLIIVDEKNTTFRAKERYFDIFPQIGFKRFLPKELFLLNINLDAIAALIILEDFCNYKFEFPESLETKTWQK